jgi:cytochrome c oxidase subunit 2
VLSVAWLAGSGWLLAAAVAPHAAVRPAGEAEQARRVEVTASRYAFEPALIEVRQGETVEIVAHSKDTDHGFAIKALGVKLAIPKGGATSSATFVADKPGRYTIECSEYCGSGHKRMKGELVVVEPGR